MRSALFRWLHGDTVRRLAEIPGPTPSFPGGNIGLFLGRNPWEVCADLGKEYGGACLVWLFGKPAVVLNDPDLIGEVLANRPGDFYKKQPVEALAPVITPGSLFITNIGQGWEKARREHPLSAPAIDDWLNRQIEPLGQAAAVAVRGWVGQSEKEPIDLYSATQRLMFDLFSLAFWGRTLEPEWFDRFHLLARTGDRRMSFPVPHLPPLSPFFYPARERWYAEFTKLVEDARHGPPSGAADLLAASRESPLSDAALAEALATNFFGGVFSCSSTVNTALYLLAGHPAAKAEVVRAVRDIPSTFDRTALDACQPLEYAIREAMRYYPAVPLYFRNSAPDREVMLGSYRLPPDTMLMISNWYLHKFSPHWSGPEAFDPNRWANGGSERNPYGSDHFFPFGRGPRACEGAAFGQFIHRLVLATVYREAEPEFPAGQKYEQSFFFGVMMPKGLTARFNIQA